MDVKLLNSFIDAVFQVFREVANLELKKERVQFYEEGHKFNADVATLLGFTGSLKGQLVISLNEKIAKGFASAILMGVPVEEFNELAESGVCEMVNMVGGKALANLLEQGYTCDLSVPSIVRGKMVEIGFVPKTPMFAADFSSDWGPIRIMIMVRVDASKPST